MIFNKQVTKQEFEKVKATVNIKLKLTEWNEETKSLDVYGYEDAWKNWWKEASKKQKATITDIKYFDKEIFKSITGIDVNDDDMVEITVDNKTFKISHKSAEELKKNL